MRVLVRNVSSSVRIYWLAGAELFAHMVLELLLRPVLRGDCFLSRRIGIVLMEQGTYKTGRGGVDKGRQRQETLDGLRREGKGGRGRNGLEKLTV